MNNVNIINIKSLLTSSSSLSSIISKILFKLSKLQNIEKILSQNLELIFTLISYSHIFSSEVIKLSPHVSRCFKQLQFRLKLILSKYSPSTCKPPTQSNLEETENKANQQLKNIENEKLFARNKATYNHFFDLCYSRDLYGIISTISNLKLIYKTFKSLSCKSKKSPDSRILLILKTSIQVIDLIALTAAVLLEAIGVGIYTTILPTCISNHIQSAFESLFEVKINDLCDWTFTQAYKIITIRFAVDLLKALPRYKTEIMNMDTGNGVKDLIINVADLIFLHSWGWPKNVNSLAFAGSGLISALIKAGRVVEAL